MPSSNERIVGKCGNCGGLVVVPVAYLSTEQPVPRCEDCGASADRSAGLRTIPMKNNDNRKD